MFERLMRIWNDRRKKSQPVAVERRKLSRAAADEQLCSAIERFNQTVARKKEELAK